jgi:branched-chain amino acid transport system permease protein
MLEQQLVNALSLGSVYALFALGFTLVFGVLGVVNLSHGAVFMLGAYAGLQVVTRLQCPLWAALLCALLLSGTTGLLIDAWVLRPLRERQAPHLIPMIATIGVGIFLNSMVQGFFGADNLRFPPNLLPDEQLHFLGIQLGVLDAAIMSLSFVLMLSLFFLMKKTQTGRALRAIAESPKAAALLGIHVERLFRITSFAAAGLGGVSGVLIALQTNAVSPLMGQPILHKGIAVIILGGMGDIRGALLGGLFLGFAEVLSVAYIGSDMRDAVTFGLLFSVLLLRPQGLFGQVLERKA